MINSCLSSMNFDRNKVQCNVVDGHTDDVVHSLDLNRELRILISLIKVFFSLWCNGPRR